MDGELEIRLRSIYWKKWSRFVRARVTFKIWRRFKYNYSDSRLMRDGDFKTCGLFKWLQTRRSRTASKHIFILSSKDLHLPFPIVISQWLSYFSVECKLQPAVWQYFGKNEELKWHKVIIFFFSYSFHFYVSYLLYLIFSCRCWYLIIKFQYCVHSALRHLQTLLRHLLLHLQWILLRQLIRHLLRHFLRYLLWHIFPSAMVSHLLSESRSDERLVS